MKFVSFLVLCAAQIAVGIEHDFKGFDDSILFGINWPGSRENLENLVEGEVSQTPSAEKNLSKEILKVTSSDQEQYECHLPDIRDKQTTNIEDYDGPSPLNLLKPLFSQKICSYRLESYWSYEVCHGRYIRQYHEERDGKQVKVQEFYLGHWSLERQLKLEAEVKAAQEAKEPLPTTKVEGVTSPYVDMVMEDGTLCDLSGKPRRTRLLYVCYSHGKHEVYSFKEVSTCEYEIIILSPLLCEHPQFKPKEISENAINCFAIGDSPKKPRSALQMEVDSLKFHHQSIRLLSNNDKDANVNAKDVVAVFKVEKIEKDGETHLKFELHPLTDEEALVDARDRVAGLPAVSKPPGVITDDSPVRAFLNGENCLNGGTGWWKYEFCYGRHVLQYHVDRNGEKTSVLLGAFEEESHLEWIRQNKAKAPKPLEQRTSISHLYSGGDVCDKTGRSRQTEVKLKCLENSSSPAQVSLYLLEPRTCHYILGVESPLICDILPLADENGLVKDTRPSLTRQEAVVDSKDEEESETKQKDVLKFGND